MGVKFLKCPSFSESSYSVTRYVLVCTMEIISLVWESLDMALWNCR